MRSPKRLVLPTALAAALALGVPALGACHEPEGPPSVPPHPTDPTNGRERGELARGGLDASLMADSTATLDAVALSLGSATRTSAQ
jgi:hypothetical protein